MILYNPFFPRVKQSYGRERKMNGYIIFDTAELRDGITKQPNTYSMKSVLDYIELRMRVGADSGGAHPHALQNTGY